jgi:TMEM175 potassium channel family protein
VASLWPAYLAYVVSFATIGAVWLGHNAITDYLDRTDTTFVRLNLLLLLFVAFLPFPTRLFADYIGEDRPERVAAAIYGIILLLTQRALPAQALRGHRLGPQRGEGLLDGLFLVVRRDHQKLGRGLARRSRRLG